MPRKLQYVFGVGLLMTAVFLLPGRAGAQPFCVDKPSIDPFMSQCVVSPAAAIQAGFPGFGAAACAALCPPQIGFANCWPTLDDAVHAPPTVPGDDLIPFPFPHSPQPKRVIGVFGPTVEVGSIPGCNLGLSNVVIDRDMNPAITDAGGIACPAPYPYPLLIEECHNAKINAGVPNLPVIDILANSGGNPVNPVVGPVLINGLDVIGGSVGIQVANFSTTLKAIRSHSNGIGVQVLGGNNVINGSTFNNNINGGLVLAAGSFSNTAVNNRARLNGGNGFVDDGADNLWRGNVAEQNFLNGFFVSLGGAFNTFLDNRSKNNYGDGFNVPGAGNVFDKNQATCNQQDGFDVTGAENSFDNSRSCGNAVNPADFEYRIAGPGTVDTGGNRVCNMPVTLDTPPPLNVPRPPNVKACFKP